MDAGGKLGVILEEETNNKGNGSSSSSSNEAKDDDGSSYMVRYENMYPYLLVNVGSGTSVLKVDGENNFQRVDGMPVFV